MGIFYKKTDGDEPEQAEPVAQEAAPVEAKTESGTIAIDKETLLALMREARRESPEIEEEKARIAERRKNARENLRKAITQADAVKKAAQANCDHMKHDHLGRPVESAIQGQIHSDEMFHGICVRCFKEFDPTPRKSAPRAGGVISGVSL